MFVPKLTKTLIVILCLLFVLPTSWVSATERKPPHVLIVYDSLAKGTSKEGNIEALQRLLATYGVQVTYGSVDTYEKGTLQQYQKVIGINNDDLPLNNSIYASDLDRFDGDYLHIGYQIPLKAKRKLDLSIQMGGLEQFELSIGEFSQSNIQVQHVPYIQHATGQMYGEIVTPSMDEPSSYGVRHGQYAYVPYYEKGNLSELALAYLLKDWLGVTAKGNNYVVFKDVYPFSNLELLSQLADQLYDAGIPFMLSIQPVFYNTDYPSMKRYYELLKYVQSRNGSILVNAPSVLTANNAIFLNKRTLSRDF